MRITKRRHASQDQSARGSLPRPVLLYMLVWHVGFDGKIRF